MEIWDTSANYINKAVRDSLQRLQTDYLDLYQLHGGTTEDNWEEITDTFESLKKKDLFANMAFPPSVRMCSCHFCKTVMQSAI